MRKLGFELSFTVVQMLVITGDGIACRNKAGIDQNVHMAGIFIDLTRWFNLISDCVHLNGEVWRHNSVVRWLLKKDSGPTFRRRCGDWRRCYPQPFAFADTGTGGLDAN